MFDLVIRGGEVLDGTGTPPVRADLGVRAGRIAALGDLAGTEAAGELDATGRYLMPGFVDTHCHAESALFGAPVQQALLRQGVTTVLLGQDGLSYAPGSPSTVDFVTRYFGAIFGRHPGFTGGRVGELLATYDRATPLNAAYLVPHATVRYEVLGAARRAPDGDELAAMRRLVEEGLDDGAAGLSSGLEYVPGKYADAAELAYLCAPLGARPYVTHMRGYGPRAGVGMGEATEIASAARVPLHVSHYHGPAAQLTALLDEAGDVTFDSYPYTRASSILAMVALPDWLPTADLSATTAALRDAAVRARLRAEWPDDLWPRIRLACVFHPDWAWAEGLTLAAAAERAGLDPADFTIELLVADKLRVGCVFERRPPTTEESVRTLLRDERHMAGSDAIYLGGHPHPRGYGAFGRLLGRHVRELGDWTWPQAAVHLAARPAARFGLAGRGLLQEGYAADVVVVDPAAVGDRATYDAPRELAVGIDDVLVNGVPVLAGGALTGRRSGRALWR
ncbi:MAG: N-acyl-D-aspartate/D-glutamate deacylase [Actinobacteria bacterium 13_2_20CM_2_72_6]|nr:MAG: N-acyl-D-aspartate/D-glutamate deacylase [Actinobacteria bacterium 13_2_20CM_2_72_6]